MQTFQITKERTESNEKIVISYAMPFLNLPASGETAQQLADSLYEWGDKNLVVCAAAAVWNGNGWDLAVKNLHEVL